MGQTSGEDSDKLGDVVYELIPEVTDIVTSAHDWELEGNSTLVSSQVLSLSGHINIPIMYNFYAFNDDPLSGYLSMLFDLEVSVANSDYTEFDQCNVTFGSPYVSASLFSNMSCYSYCSVREPTYWLDQDLISSKQSIRFSTVLSLNQFDFPNMTQVGYTVVIPFTWNFFLTDWSDPLRDSHVNWVDMMSYSIRPTYLFNTIDEYSIGIGSDIGSIRDKTSQMYSKLYELQNSSQEQLTEQKKQGEEKRGFFASIINWLTNFPEMLVGIVVPDSEYFSSFFDELMTFISDRLGFLSLPFDLLYRIVDLFVGDVNTSTVLTFPGFRIMGHQVWNDFDVDIVAILGINSEMSSILFNSIQFVTSIIIIGAFVNLCQSKFYLFFERSESD